MANDGGIKDTKLDSSMPSAGDTEKSKGLKSGGDFDKKAGAVNEKAKKGGAASIAEDAKKAVKDPKAAVLDNMAKRGGKAGAAAKKMKDTVEKIKMIRRIINVVQKVVQFIIKWAKPIAIVAAVVILVFNLVVFSLGVAQSVAPSPHYYCDFEANRAIKNSEVYKQYCTRRELIWGVDNINGHYIVQDGVGPASSCAMANMLLRFYTIDTTDLWFGETNVYEYLWQSDGQYNNKGNSLGNSTTANNSLRNILNDYNIVTPNKEDSTATMPNGSREFANLNGKTNYDMSNWGYLRDDTIDVKDYQQTSSLYEDNKENKKWVWDLSFDNEAPGSVWGFKDGASWEKSFRMNTTKFNVEQMVPPSGSDAYQILNKRLIDVLNGSKKKDSWSQYYKGSSGVMVEYEKIDNSAGKSITHTILITKREVNGSNVTWYGVDSSLGTSGGWEGPLDGSGNFVADDTAIASLLSGLDSNNGTVTASIGGKSYTFIIKRIGYCTRARFGFWF